MNEQRTIGDVIRGHAALRPEHPAIVASGFAPFTYRELQALIDQIRTDLHQAGYDRSARIAIALPTGPHAALAIIAIACSAVAVPIDPNLSKPEIEIRLKLLQPHAILLLEGEQSALSEAAQYRGIEIFAVRIRDASIGLRIGGKLYQTTNSADGPEANSAAFILQSSGTAAEPKLIPSSHAVNLAVVEIRREAYRLTPDDICLCTVPVYYGHAIQGVLLAQLLTGGGIAFPENPLSLDLGEWFIDLRPTWYSAVPTLLLFIIERVRLRPDVAMRHSLRFIQSGGAPLPKGVREEVESVLGVPVVEIYASSEGAISTNYLRPGPCKPETCGIPWQDTLKIVGAGGHQLPPGQQGEIWVRGPTVISGYLDAPELDQEAFIDGWFRTGDVGSLDEDGFLTLHGRLKELINKGGEKISPAEIDAALQRHPDVAEAAAYPVPHPRLGEDVAAAVVLNPDAVVTPSALQKFLREYLSWSKIPRRIVVLDQLPRGPTGKVQRRQLRESAE